MKMILTTCNDDSGGTQSQVIVPLAAGETVQVVVDGFGGDSGNRVLNIAQSVPGDCCTETLAPGCADAACETSVCGVDVLCGDTEWDGVCVSHAQALCGALCPLDLSCIEQDIGGALGVAVAMGTTVGEDEDIAQSCAAGGSVDRIVSFTAPATASFVFDTAGSGYDTALAAYADCGSSSELACNDDAIMAQSEIILDLTIGQQVLLAVSGYDGLTGAWILNIDQL